jgi:hypothetical protein
MCFYSIFSNSKRIWCHNPVLQRYFASTDEDFLFGIPPYTQPFKSATSKICFPTSVHLKSTAVPPHAPTTFPRVFQSSSSKLILITYCSPERYSILSPGILLVTLFPINPYLLYFLLSFQTFLVCLFLTQLRMHYRILVEGTPWK